MNITRVVRASVVAAGFTSCGTLERYPTPVPPAATDSTPTGEPDPDSPPVVDPGCEGRCDAPECVAVCDADGDGDRAEAYGGGDCDDADSDVHPGAEDPCNGADDDCDGAVDGADIDADGVTVCDDCDDADPGRFPGAFDTCDGVDSDCDTTDCLGWSDDFESGVLALPFLWSGDAAWRTVEGVAHSGDWTSGSGAITDGERSSLELTLQWAAPGEISFWHLGSVELDYDWFKFMIDGVEVGSWTGDWAWTLSTFPVDAGTHTFEWRFRKDGSVSQGEDGVLLDQIATVGGAP
ncbi:MAG: putative metal-binding motif-containing protein [Myxococcota bacterium]